LKFISGLALLIVLSEINTETAEGKLLALHERSNEEAE
jgi:hypothetical protein